MIHIHILQEKIDALEEIEGGAYTFMQTDVKGKQQYYIVDDKDG